MCDEFDRPEMECEECGWQGDSTELLFATEDLDDRDFCLCPDCNSKDVFDIDYEDD